jgi:plastocyanin
MRKQSWVILACSTLNIAFGVGGFFGASGAEEASLIEIENFAFDPPALTVQAGARIVFTNRDPVPHSIVGLRDGQEMFRSSEQLDTDETFTVVADKPGEIELQCGLHARIIGKIQVKP